MMRNNKLGTIEVAQIVPVSHLSDIAGNRYHMCLAHLALQDERYAKFYRSMSDAGKYVMMDNGAAEDSQLTNEDLVKAYNIIHPSEMVLPDTLLDGFDTVRKTVAFLHEYADRLDCNFMAVPQGRTFDVWRSCAATLAQLPRVSSIGISKFLNIALKSRYVRMDAADHIAGLIAVGRANKGLDVHLLGCDEGPDIVSKICAKHEFVRGCDSAFVYIATQAGVAIDRAMDRPEGTIDFINGAYLDGYAENAKRFEEIIKNGWC